MSGNIRSFTYISWQEETTQCLETKTNVVPILRSFRLLIPGTGDTAVNKTKQNLCPHGACLLVWGGRRGQGARAICKAASFQRKAWAAVSLLQGAAKGRYDMVLSSQC